MESDVFYVEFRPGCDMVLASVEDDVFKVVHLGLSPRQAAKFAWWLLSHVHREILDEVKEEMRDVD